MFVYPRIIPAALQARMERVETRRGYAELTEALNATVDDLYVVDDHDARAALLEQAAALTDQLAERHTAAWGREDDGAGRSAADSLTGRAWLLRQLAATERAVIGTATWSDAALVGDVQAAELRAWTVLAHTAEPGRRAVCLRMLHTLAAARLGERAAEVLAVLAGIEARRAVGLGRPESAGFVLPRLVIAAVFVLVAVVAVVPWLAELDAAGHLALLVGGYGGLAAFFTVLWLIERRRARGTS